MGLLKESSVAIDGSKFKAVNNRDKNFTPAKWTLLRFRFRFCALCSKPRF
jgi:hypothetical protein